MELLLQLHRIALRERGQSWCSSAYASSSAFATSARPECLATRAGAGGGGLGGDHAEGLREDRGHDDDVRERDQAHEMAVLQLAR